MDNIILSHMLHNGKWCSILRVLLIPSYETVFNMLTELPILIIK